jgi:NAD(P)-dependent dehydrogenase (short-subunit alcohol dehydrogenase family)
MFVVCDVTIYDSQSALFRKVWERWQRIDVVVANAGVVDRDSKYMLRANPSDSFVEPSREKPDTTCTDVNLKGCIYTFQLATNYMQRNPGGKAGKIITTSSVLGLHANPTFPEYCAAKAGLNQCVKAIAPILLYHHNIAVNSIMPGPIETEVMPDMADAFPPEHMTLRSTLLRCFQSYIEDTTGKSGDVVEVGHSASIVRYDPAHGIGGAAEQCWKTPYDPWFEALHGAKSGLTDARSFPCSQELL